jgi:hypothetical protein
MVTAIAALSETMRRNNTPHRIADVRDAAQAEKET